MAESGLAGAVTTRTPGPVVTGAHTETVKVTRADNGRRYRLAIGDRLDVRLSGPSAVTWTEPVSSDQAVLRRIGGSSGLRATGTFTGTVKGSVTVTASGDDENCPTCLGPIYGFGVTVSITN
jgi:hypothetical protein